VLQFHSATAPQNVSAVNIRATPEAKLRFPSTSVSQGWLRFVRFQEVERTQQMTGMGAKPPGP
jgi:hypothetical protein